MEIRAASEEAAYDTFLTYLADCVRQGDVTCFDFVEDKPRSLKEQIEDANDRIREAELELEELWGMECGSRKGIAIVEGRSYVTRCGEIRGPMRPITDDRVDDDYAWTDSPHGETIYSNVWTAEGFYIANDPDPDDMDLVAEANPEP